MTAAARPLRVLIACDHIDYNGAIHGGGRQLVELTRGLLDAGVEPTVCVLRGASELGRQFQAEGLPFQFFGDHRLNPATVLRLVRLIRERDIQVLHLTDYGASTFGRIAGLITGTPSIVQIISHHSSFQRKGFPRHVELAFRALAPLTAHALAISSSVKEFAVQHMGFADSEVEVLHYPLPRYSFTTPDPERVAAMRLHLGIPASDPVVGAVTRFFPSKGITHLVREFARVLEQVPHAWLVLVGQGPEEETLRAQCERLGIGDRVKFAGFQRDAHVFVAGFDVSVVPSLEEGFGLVAVESLALGVPVVASRRGGLPDVVVDDVTGILVEPTEEGSISSAILRLLTEPELRGRMSRAARQDVERFSLDIYLGRLIQLYSLLARPSRPSRLGRPSPKRGSGRSDGPPDGGDRPQPAALRKE